MFPRLMSHSFVYFMSACYRRHLSAVILLMQGSFRERQQILTSERSKGSASSFLLPHSSIFSLHTNTHTQSVLKYTPPHDIILHTFPIYWRQIKAKGLFQTFETRHFEVRVKLIKYNTVCHSVLFWQLLQQRCYEAVTGSVPGTTL